MYLCFNHMRSVLVLCMTLPHIQFISFKFRNNLTHAGMEREFTRVILKLPSMNPFDIQSVWINE